MQTVLKSLVAGFIGATAVTLLHECIRKKYAGAPRLDVLGQEATASTLENLGATVPNDKSLYVISLVGDIIANTFYYSAAGLKKKSPLLGGAALGLTAGLGAVNLPDKMGLDGSLTAATPQRRGITVGLYTLGGVITGLVMRRLNDQRTVHP